MSNHKAHPLGGRLVSWPVMVLAVMLIDLTSERLRHALIGRRA